MTLQHPTAKALARVQADFVSILPRIERHARFAFRRVHCPAEFDDCVAETVAICWLWHLRLAEQGRDATAFPSVLANYAARAVKSGRRLCGQENARDVCSNMAQQRRGFCVGKLPDVSTLSDNPLSDALIDTKQSTVPEQVNFRVEFPRWLLELPERNQQLTVDMAFGHRTGDLARHYRLSPARVSQLRQEFKSAWELCEEGSARHPRRGPS